MTWGASSPSQFVTLLFSCPTLYNILHYKPYTLKHPFNLSRICSLCNFDNDLSPFFQCKSATYSPLMDHQEPKTSKAHPPWGSLSHYCPSGVSADQNGHLRIIPGYNPSSGIAPPHNPSSRARAAQNPPKMLGPLGNCGCQGSKYLLMDKKLGSFRLYVEPSDL